MSQIDRSRLSFLFSFEKSLPEAPNTRHLNSANLSDQLLISPGLSLAEARLPQLEGSHPIHLPQWPSHSCWLVQTHHVTLVLGFDWPRTASSYPLRLCSLETVLRRTRSRRRPEAGRRTRRNRRRSRRRLGAEWRWIWSRRRLEGGHMQARGHGGCCGPWCWNMKSSGSKGGAVCTLG